MEIIANTWKIHQGRNVETVEQLLRANPRKLKDLRAVRRPGSEDDLTARLDRMGGVVAPRQILVEESL